MAKLDRVIDIGGVNYEVEAKTAEKVENALTINKTNFDGTTAATPLVEFNGDDPKEVEIVPALGGKFKGHIRVPAAQQVVKVGGNDVTNIETKSGKTDFRADAVLNYGDIKEKVLTNLLNASILYNWNGTELDPVIDQAITGISIVTGSESNLLDPSIGFAYLNSVNKKISAYLYVCSDTKDLYFGTDSSIIPTRLVSNTNYAASAGELANAGNIIVNLDPAYREVATTFNGNADIITGTTGVLPVSAGGTGKTDLSNVSVGYAGCLTDGPNEIRPHHLISLDNRVDAIVKGDLRVEKANNAVSADDADHATEADQATNAIGTSQGTTYNIAKNFYRGTLNTTAENTITISNSGPAADAGVEGDIWIVWSNV